MKILSAEFKISAPGIAEAPNWDLPEFAFIGRSNVGKSSLINLLAGRRELALVSGTPGKTRLLNFFAINGRWSLVDLPGYGYAAGGQRERSRFNQAVAVYLAERPNLARVFVLIDSRLPPQAIDLEFLEWLGRCPAPHALVFTKTDKQSATRTRQNVATILAGLKQIRVDEPAYFLSSATHRIGRDEILGRITADLAELHRAGR